MTPAFDLNTGPTPQPRLHRYRVFGLVLVSDIPLCTLAVDATSQAPAITVRSSAEAPVEFEPQDRGLLWKSAPATFALTLPDVATITVRNGDDVCITAARGAAQMQIETLILSAGLGAAMQQRGAFLLHAATFETSAGAVALAGVSGSGKSLLLGALNKRGYPVIADDITAVTATSNGLSVDPAWPCLRLMPDAFAPLGIEPPNATSPQQDGKQNVPIAPFAVQSTQLNRIVFLHWTPHSEITIAPEQGVAALSKLSSNVYRRTFLKGMGLLEGHFKSLNHVAAQARFSSLTRPHDLGALERVVDRLEDGLGISPPCATSESHRT